MIVYLLAVILLLLIVKKFYSRQYSRFPPGPTGFPILGCLPWLGSEPHIDIDEMGKKYGKIFSLKLGTIPLVVLNDLELIKSALKTDAFTGRPNHLPALSIAKGGTIYNTGPAWKEQRRFVLQSLRDMGFGKTSGEELIRTEVQDLIQYLRKNGKTPIFPREIFQVSVVNSIWTIVSGEKFTLEDFRVRKLQKLAYEGLVKPPTAGIFFFLPWVVRLFPNLVGFSKSTHAVEQLEEMAKDIIDKQTATFDAGELRHFADAYRKKMLENQNNENSSFHGTEGEYNFIWNILNLFIAGGDTLSTTLSWTVAYLATFPQISDKLYTEITTVVGKSRMPSLQDRKQMPYTEAVMSEILRSTSIVPGALLHSANESTEFADYSIPKGTIIWPNLYGVHFNEKIWKDPHNFRPERFIGNDGKYQKSDALIPFSYGKRSCLAESMAMNEFFLYLTGLVQNFEFAFHLKAPSINDLKGLSGVVVAPKPFFVTFSSRE